MWLAVSSECSVFNQSLFDVERAATCFVKPFSDVGSAGIFLTPLISPHTRFVRLPAMPTRSIGSSHRALWALWMGLEPPPCFERRLTGGTKSFASELRSATAVQF